MHKALVTFGSGRSAELLALTLPTFKNYADRHGYDVVVGDGGAHGRPPSWGKILLLQEALRSYDFALWIDADAIILDATVDIETVIPADAFQALAFPSLGGANSTPCAGVWALRAGARAQDFLAEAWRQEDLVDHWWWDQAAVMRLTGWTTSWPPSKERSSAWDDGTFALAEEWDMIPAFPIRYAAGRIRHYAGWSHRRRRFAMGTDLAELRGARSRYLVGVLVRRWWLVFDPVNSKRRYWMGRR